MRKTSVGEKSGRLLLAGKEPQYKKEKQKQKSQVSKFLLQAGANTAKLTELCSSKLSKQSENPTVQVASGLKSTAVGLKMRK